jgi:hypothetical protein
LREDGTVSEFVDISTGVYEPTESEVHRLMQFLNTSMNRDGGYIWRGESPNLQQIKHVDEPMDVIPGYYAQQGDQWVIPDEVVYDTTRLDSEVGQ